MYILRLTPFFHHPDVKSWPAAYDPLGGMQIQTWRQAMWLAQNGVRQHVMTIGFPGLPRERNLHENLRVERSYFPLPEFRSELTGLWGLTQSWVLATLLKLRSRARQHPFDLVHVHLDGQIPALLMACLTPHLLRQPMVLTIHCSRLSVYQPMSAWDRAGHRIACYLERKALSAAATTIALTEHTAQVARCYARHLEVLPDVVDPQQFCRPESSKVVAFRQRYGLNGQTVGFVGRIAKEKGWPHFILIAERLRHLGLSFLVVGDGPQRSRLEAMVAAHGLQSQVTITGFIPNDQIPAALAACSAVVMPSEHEELGSVALEATAVGTPVVGYCVGGIKEILSRISPELLVPPGDVQQLAERVRWVLTRCHDMETHGSDDFAHAFAPDTVLPRLAELYNELIASPSPHATGRC